MKNHKTQKRLISYSAMGTALLAIGNTAETQIVYYDFDPDIILDLSGEMWGDEPYDLNGDGLTDFNIEFSNWYYSGGGSYKTQRVDLEFDPSNGMQFHTVVDPFDTPIHNNIVKLDHDDMIFPPAKFGTALDFQTIEWDGWDPDTLWPTDGNFLEADDNYVGFRLPLGGPAYIYGWIRLSAEVIMGPSPDFTGGFLYKVTVKDYAINYTANDAILAGEGLPCLPPTPEGTFFITTTSAKVKWDALINADEYHLFYRQVGATGWTKKHVEGEQKKISGLTCNTSYEWKVRSACDGDNSAFSALQTFTTAPCRMDGGSYIDQLEVLVYPNPAGDKATVEIEGFSGEIHIGISDMMGNTVTAFSQQVTDNGIALDISNLPSGIYILTVSDNSGSENIKFIHH